ncbi:DNA polymerase III subunit epsilon [Psychrobacter sp. 1U2]|uniref:DNA polymerase III subunit epsilon n=1 Tax=Psychrobacter sp. 1U2 TaxID=3453577 RepID=UPI003F46E97E
MSDNRSTTQTTSTQTRSLNKADPLAAKDNTTIAYTDGACKGNPGAGGWGAHLIFSDGQTKDLYGGEDATTNNRMELMGAIQALQHSANDVTLEIWTDSSYVKNGITDWIDGWKKRDWKTAGKKPVANKDLWQQLDALRQDRTVEWHWVKGHAGHAGNEKADELANLGVTASSAHNIANSSVGSIVDNPDDSRKKKAAINEPVLSENDWLNFDPLGLDDFEDIDNDDFDNIDNIDDSTDKLEAEVDYNPDHATAVQSTSQPYQAADTHLDANSNTTLNSKNTEDNASILPSITTDTTSTDMTAENDLQHSDTQAADLPAFDGDTSRANPNFKPLLPEPTHRGESNRQLIMDTETTGLDALKGDRIIEVGIVELVGRKFTGEKLHVYINPQRGMDEEVIRIHGISEAFLQDKPTFDKVAQKLYDFMDGAEIIAHNASFDMNFLTMEFNKVGLSDFAERVQVTDSLLMAKQQYPGQKNTLDALVRRLDVGKQDRTFHGALLDSEILAEVYLAMTGGQVSLAIEEDSVSEGGQTAHATFANLATLLLDSSQDDKANRDWFMNLAEDYPVMNDSLANW